MGSKYTYRDREEFNALYPRLLQEDSAAYSEWLERCETIVEHIVKLNALKSQMDDIKQACASALMSAIKNTQLTEADDFLEICVKVIHDVVYGYPHIHCSNGTRFATVYAGPRYPD